jgi:hypothetical protein
LIQINAAANGRTYFALPTQPEALMRSIKNGLFGAGICLALLASGFSIADGTLPAVREQGQTHYLTGGIGVEEAKAVRAEKSKYPLNLTFLAKAGKIAEFTSSVDVSVANGKGNSVLKATSDGPFMLIDLPPGKYRITATSEGRTKSRDVDIFKGHHAQLTFEWPQRG